MKIEQCDICKGFLPERYFRVFVVWTMRFVVFASRGEKPNEIHTIYKCSECHSLK